MRILHLLVIGALLFNNFLDLTRVPAELGGWLAGLQVPGLVVMLAILGIYLLLGCVLESMSMILLTVPMFYPLVAHLGYDLVWFGIIVVVVTEISMITPPVGLNVFVLRSVLPDVPTQTVLGFLGSRATWPMSRTAGVGRPRPSPPGFSCANSPVIIPGRTLILPG